MKVRDLMTTSVESVSPGTDLMAVARRMKELDVGAVPVIDNNQLVGIITDRDIVIRAIAEGRDPQIERVEDYLTPNPTTISPDADVKEAAQVMSREQIRRLPVIEDGELIGWLSLGDLAVDAGKDNLVGNALEQISEPSQPSAG